jgi:hypothetical protein
VWGDDVGARSDAILTELLQLKQRQELLEMNLVQVDYFEGLLVTKEYFFSHPHFYFFL